MHVGGWVHADMMYLSAESPIQVVTGPDVEKLRW